LLWEEQTFWTSETSPKWTCHVNSSCPIVGRNATDVGWRSSLWDHTGEGNTQPTRTRHRLVSHHSTQSSHLDVVYSYVFTCFSVVHPFSLSVFIFPFKLCFYLVFSTHVPLWSTEGMPVFDVRTMKESLGTYYGGISRYALWRNLSVCIRSISDL